MDTQPDPGIQVAGYRIEARVGRGGMGEVYRAVQLSLGRRVALKVLAPELAADDGFRRRFLRESRIAASIDHPNVIPIHEAGEDNGLLYIAMRYVDGSDLATLLEREGRLEPARTMAIMSQVAGALDAAHARGLVHRDVKPANILMGPAAPGGGDHCYLCDFGLIKELDAELALTATDQFVGTVPYVAPEQVEGRDLDGRTDVYSLGCVVFHCLTGSPPFDGRTDVEVVFAHLRDPPPPISNRVPGLPAALDAVIARAMAKAKEDRYPTCSALVAALGKQLRAGAREPGPPVDDETRPMVRTPQPEPVDLLAAPTDPAVQRPAPPLAQPATPPPQRAATVAEPLLPDRRVGRRSGRRWLTLLAVVALAGLALVAALQVFAGERPPDAAGSPPVTGRPPGTSGPPGTQGSSCPGGFTRPAVGTPSRTEPLDAIRTHMGWTDRFVVEEIRFFTGPDELKRWYVKAHQERSPSRRGRWLVEQDRDGQRRVVATAAYDSSGYGARDWRATAGQGTLPDEAAGCLDGT